MASREKSPKTVKKSASKETGGWRDKLPWYLLIALGLGLITVTGIVLFIRAQKTSDLVDVSDITDFGQVVTEDTDNPDENKPNVDAVEYEVPDAIPRRIIMPDISVNGFVQQVGINDENAVAVPTNIHIAGWFIDSVLPGEEGLSIIDGHVSGRYSDGIFKQLDALVAGSIYEIEFGDRSRKAFEVVSVHQMPEIESAEILFKKDPTIESQLNLITCGGNYNPDNQSYGDRVIVVSKAI